MNTGMRITRFLLACLLGLALGVWSLPLLTAQQTDQSTEPTQVQPTQGNKQGSQAAGQPAGSAQAQSSNQKAADLLNNINKGQIDLGTMMQGQASNASVKDYSKMVTDDHQQAQDKLQTLASQSNMTLTVSKKSADANMKLKDKLSNAEGAQRDKEFLQAEVKEHQEAIKDLKKIEPKVTDAQLKTYISDILPTLQKHESEASKLLTQMSGPAAGAPAGQAQPQGTEQKPPMSETPPSGQTPPDQQNPPLF